MLKIISIFSFFHNGKNCLKIVRTQKVHLFQFLCNSLFSAPTQYFARFFLSSTAAAASKIETPRRNGVRTFAAALSC